MTKLQKLKLVHQQLKNCQQCPNMCDQAVHGPAVNTHVMILGQAPGVHEASIGKPFAYTAGKTLFKWLHEATQKDEDYIRTHVYFTAVARCFPGKAKNGGGDREPTPLEIANCREFIRAEVQILKPKFIIALGKLAIREALGEKIFGKNTLLKDVVGKTFDVIFHGIPVTVIPLPHPSGVSSWPHRMPGKRLLAEGLSCIERIFAPRK